MKTIQSKSLLTLIIIFFIVGFTTSAKSIIDLPDFSLVNLNPQLNQLRKQIRLQLFILLTCRNIECKLKNI